MSQVPVKWVRSKHELWDRPTQANVTLPDLAVPVVPLSALREVVEGLKRNAENEPEQNGYLSAIIDLQRLLASLGEVGELGITHDPHPGKFQASEDLPGS